MHVNIIDNNIYRIVNNYNTKINGILLDRSLPLSPKDISLFNQAVGLWHWLSLQPANIERQIDRSLISFAETDFDRKCSEE
jgi:hypothetical protein